MTSHFHVIILLSSSYASEKIQIPKLLELLAHTSLEIYVILLPE